MSIHEQSTSFASFDEAEAYHMARNTAYWPVTRRSGAASEAQDTETVMVARKQAALVRATDWLNTRVHWNGRKCCWDQPLAWPRTDVVVQGQPVPADTIPPQVRDACCELAAHFMHADPLAPQERGGRILAESVDCLSVTYAADAPTDTLFPMVEGLLRHLGQAESSASHAACVELGRG